jgi:hypothetical protein
MMLDYAEGISWHIGIMQGRIIRYALNECSERGDFSSGMK